MKFAIILSIARQVEGEYVLCRVIKASSNPEILHKYLRSNDLPRTAKIGDIDCVIEYGVIEDIEPEEA